MDKYRIDDHKLYWHMERVSKWQKGEIVAPIYIEVSPVGFCNHNCIFCGVDFGKEGQKLNTDIFCKRVMEMGQAGVKSIMFAGEGEPLLHKDLPKIIETTKKSGIDVGITTNGTVGTEELWKSIIPNTQWVKFSVDAGSKEVFSKVHGINKDLFEKTVKSIKAAIKVNQSNKNNCTLGAQFLLIDENIGDLENFLKIFANCGLDYIVIKPYSLHPQMLHKMETVYNGNIVKYTQELINKYETKETKIIFREKAFNVYENKEKKYCHCYALPFWGHITAGGDVYTCSVYIGDDRFKIGNINETTIDNILWGEKRKQSINYGRNELSIEGECRINCRMSRINEFLEFLEAKPNHINFI